MATAPFDVRVVPVRPSHRGREYGDIRLEHRARSLDYHMVKRTVVDGQWRIGTTESQFLEDLRTAIRDRSARIAAFERRGVFLTAVIARTGAVVPVDRIGPSPFPLLLVVYSVDHDIIVTGYQFSSMEEISIPEEAWWLT